MKIKREIELQAFLKAVDEAKSDVILRTSNGDDFNLKSLFSKYMAIGELLSEHGNELELFCMNKNDESLFLKFFYEYPEVL